MFYTFRDEVENITAEEAKVCGFSLGFVGNSESDKIGRLLDLPQNRVETPGYYKYGDCVCACFERMKLYIRSNYVIMLCENPKEYLPLLRNLLSRLDGGEVGKAGTVYAIIDELLANENNLLSDFQQTIAILEKQVLDGKENENLNRVLYCEKQKCISRSNYYSKMQSIVDELKDNDFEIFDESDLKYFDILSDKISRLRDDVRLIIDSTVHLRDAYQSALDLRLNNTMKLFTVVTVVFAPLGFITGWFGMNFKNMSFISSPHGTLIAAIICVAATVGTVVWLKLKK